MPQNVASLCISCTCDAFPSARVCVFARVDWSARTVLVVVDPVVQQLFQAPVRPVELRRAGQGVAPVHEQARREGVPADLGMVAAPWIAPRRC